MVKWEYRMAGWDWDWLELGREGWELVTVVKENQPGMITGYFKRPLDGSQNYVSLEELDELDMKHGVGIPK